MPGLLLAACSDPQCPPDEGKVQDVCFPLGGMDAEVEEDAEAEAEADVEADAEPARDARIDSSRVDAQPAEASDACGGSCKGGTPVCTPGGQCVGCSATERGACTESQQCDVLAGACVECLQQTDCKDPKASVCDSTTHKCKACGVSSVNDCDHVAGKNVCAAGECVECTAANRAACKTGDNQAAVCDGSQRSCAPYAVGGTGLCGACVSDAQCEAGQRCVQTLYEDQAVGWFCQWQRGGGSGAPALCNSSARPWLSTRPTASRDAPEGSFEMCVLRASACPAFNVFGKACGRYTSGATSFIVEDHGDLQIPQAERGQASTLAKIAADPSVCGAEGGACVSATPAGGTQTGTYRCTMRCGDLNDCKSGTCSASALCSVN